MSILRILLSDHPSTLMPSIASKISPCYANTRTQHTEAARHSLPIATRALESLLLHLSVAAKGQGQPHLEPRLLCT